MLNENPRCLKQIIISIFFLNSYFISNWLFKAKPVIVFIYAYFIDYTVDQTGAYAITLYTIFHYYITVANHGYQAIEIINVLIKAYLGLKFEVNYTHTLVTVFQSL